MPYCFSARMSSMRRKVSHKRNTMAKKSEYDMMVEKATEHLKGRMDAEKLAESWKNTAHHWRRRSERLRRALHALMALKSEDHKDHLDTEF